VVDAAAVDGDKIFRRRMTDVSMVAQSGVGWVNGCHADDSKLTFYAIFGDGGFEKRC
jgi:hypothetical protein